MQQDAILDLLVRAQARTPISDDNIEQATRALEYYQSVRHAALEAFQALAKDNTYGSGPNTAWEILGKTLGMVTSTDTPRRGKPDSEAPNG